MKRKFLEDMGLTKEQVDSILNENSQDIGKTKGDLEGVQAQLNTANQEITNLKGQVKDRDGQLESLKKSTGDVDTLKQQIETLQNDNKAKDTAHAAEIKQIKVNAAVEAALASSKARNAKAVKALITDLDTAELCEDGSIKGLHEQLEALRKAEDSSFLFESAKGSSTKPVIKGASPGQTGREEPDSKVDISRMNYEELTAYMEANPTL